MGDVAGHALDLGVGNRLDHDVVTGPVVAEPPDLVGLRRAMADRQGQRHERQRVATAHQKVGSSLR